MFEREKIAEEIIRLAVRLENIANRRVFFPLGVSAASVKILKILKQSGPLTPSQLVKLTASTKSNISQRLSNLEKSGWIERKTTVLEDGRKVLVAITVSGRRRLELAAKRIKKAQLFLAEKFSQVELASHQEFMLKVNKILDQEENCQYEI